MPTMAFTAGSMLSRTWWLEEEGRVRACEPGTHAAHDRAEPQQGHGALAPLWRGANQPSGSGTFTPPERSPAPH